jgi:uncharacterized membrane protein YphA (DoxX/SURF4 family)
MKNKILFVLSLLAGLVFINAGLDKFFHYMPVPKDMPEKMVKAGAAFIEIGWLLPLVGAVEVLAGLLLIFKRTQALAALMLVPIMTGILLTTIIMAPSALPIIIVLIAIISWIIIDSKEKFLPLIQK